MNSFFMLCVLIHCRTIMTVVNDYHLMLKTFLRQFWYNLFKDLSWWRYIVHFQRVHKSSQDTWLVNTDLSVEWNVSLWPDQFFPFYQRFCWVFYYKIDFGIQRTICSKITSKVDKCINNFESLTLNKDVMFSIALPWGQGT